MSALRRAAPAPSAFPSSKRLRGAAPAARGATARDPSSNGRVAAANRKLSSAPSRPKYTKAVRNGVVVEMEVIPAGGGGETLPGATPSLKPAARAATARAASTHRASTAQLAAPPGSKCAKAITTCGTMARNKPARCAGADEQFSAPGPKRAKVTRRDGAEASFVAPALRTLRKRMAAELDALHDLVRRAELLCCDKNGRCVAMADAKQRSETPVEASIKTPPAKRRKVSDLPKIAEFERPGDKKEFVGVGVAPVAILKASPVVNVEKDGETVNSVSESREPPEDKNEFVDICAGVSPVVSVVKAGESDSSPSSSSDSSGSSSSSSDSDSDSDSSSSDSDSDSDSSSESDSDEEVNGPAPPALHPEENAASSQPPPEPAPEAAQSTEPEIVSGGGGVCTAPPALLPEAAQPPSRRASEVAQSAEPMKKAQDVPRAAPKAISIPGAIYKAKLRRQLLEMERAVLPDESIHDQDLRCLRISEYGRHGIMRQLGLFLKTDA